MRLTRLRRLERAALDLFDQAARCRFGSNIEFIAQQLDQRFGAGERNVAAFVTRQKLQHAPLPILPHRIERYRTLADAARDRLKTLGYGNVIVITGNGFAGAPDRAPFDRVMVTAAAEAVPEALVGQLADGGKMVLPLGARKGPQFIVKLIKLPNGGLEREELIAVRFVPLLPGQAKEL